MEGKCALCHQFRDLQDSHLIPKAAYRHTQGNPGTNGQPVMLIPGQNTAFQTNRQIKVHLLCSDCEHRFSRYGEDVIGRLWATSTAFPLRDQMQSAGALESDGSLSVFDAAALPDGVVEAIRYFVISILWRASVGDWKIAENSYHNALGDKYEEQFRLFLLGQSTDVSARIFVSVNDGCGTNSMFSTPVFSRKNGAHLHSFQVLGIRFNTFVGGKFPAEIQAACGAMSSDIVFTSADFEKQPDFTRMVGWAKGATPRGKLARSGNLRAQVPIR
ncbi:MULTISPECIES: hypothetical protein [unclassified Pseudomonas]|uniref:hypothetical protein n=1 Tax=unclassified Pseudomonas TaxID=196821 RepID=UPI00235FEFFB|nr:MULTISPECIES: hypothetical protein [unclassified Pseudomonas]